MDVVDVVLVTFRSLAVLFGTAALVALWHSDPARRADALRVMDRIMELIRMLLRIR